MVRRRRASGRAAPSWACRPAGPRAVAGAAAGYGLAAALFAGTRWVPAAYCGAFAWGVAGAVFYAVAATTVQRGAPAGTLGRVTGVIATGESATEAVGLPLAGALVSLARTMKHNHQVTVDLPLPRTCIGAGSCSSVPVKGNFPGFR